MISVEGELWHKVHSVPEFYRSEMIWDMLEENGIDSIIRENKNSAFVVLEEYEIWVSKDNISKSKELIDKYFKDDKPD